MVVGASFPNFFQFKERGTTNFTDEYDVLDHNEPDIISVLGKDGF